MTFKEQAERTTYVFGLAKNKNMVGSREEDLCQYMEAHHKKTPQARWAVDLEAPATITPGEWSSHPPSPCGRLPGWPLLCRSLADDRAKPSSPAEYSI